MMDFVRRWFIRGIVTLSVELGMTVLVFSTIGFMRGIVLSGLFLLMDVIYVCFEEEKTCWLKIHNDAEAALEKAKTRPEYNMARNRGWFAKNEDGQYCIETILNRAALDVARLEDRVSKLESAGK